MDPLPGAGLRKEMDGRAEDAANVTPGEAGGAILRWVAVVDHTIPGADAAFNDPSGVCLHS